MSSFVNSLDELVALAVLMDDVEGLNLIKDFRKILGNPTQTMEVIDGLRGIQDDQMDTMSSSLGARKKQDIIRAKQLELWKYGANSKNLGRKKEDISLEMKGQLSSNKMLHLFDSAARYKEQGLENALKSIIDCFNPRYTVGLTTYSAKLDFVRTKIRDFEDGLTIEGMKSSLYRYPAESGIMLAHIVSTREWIATEVTAFIRDQYGDVGVAFCDAQESDIRKYDSVSNILLVSEDESSPYFWTHTPAFTESTDEEDIWYWRKEVVTSNELAKIQAQASSDPLLIIKQEILVGRAATTTQVAEVDSNSPVVHVTMKDSSVNHFVKVSKRGKSKLTEILETRDTIHITTAEIARSLKVTDFRSFTLSDGYTVLVIPENVWIHSHTYSDNKAITGYRAVVGCRVVDTNPFALWAALMNLGYTFKYIDYLRGSGKYPEPKDHWNLVYGHLVSGSYDRLLSFDFEDGLKSTITRMYAFSLMTGGIVLHPEVSKTGKSVLENINKYTDYTVSDTFSFSTILDEYTNNVTRPRAFVVENTFADEDDNPPSDNSDYVDQTFQGTKEYDIDPSSGDLSEVDLEE
jgi:hypothetical protein